MKALPTIVSELSRFIRKLPEVPCFEFGIEDLYLVNQRLRQLFPGRNHHFEFYQGPDGERVIRTWIDFPRHART